MKVSLRLFFIIQLFIPFLGVSQQKDSLVHKLDSLSKKTDSVGKQFNNINVTAYNENTKLSPHTYFTLLGSDLKQAFTKPFHMKGKDWGRFGKFAIVTGALAFTDEPLQQFAVKMANNNPTIRNISKSVTSFGGVGEIVTLTMFGGYGFIFQE